MELKKLLSGLRLKYFPERRKLTEAKLFGHTIKVYTGTVRETADRDDAWFCYIARNSKVVFDVGANVGYTALMTLLIKKDSRVVLFDTNPEALSVAASNIIYNNLSHRCQFICGFAGEKPGERVKFYTVGTGSAGSMYQDHAKTAAALNSWFWVSTVSLDAVASDLNLLPDFVKIDVEGAEYEVLKGAKSLAQANTVFMIEMHSNKDLPMVKNAEYILEWCRQTGYSAWYMMNGQRLDKPDTIAHRGRCHLLLLPRHLDYPAYLKDVGQNAPLPALSQD